MRSIFVLALMFIVLAGLCDRSEAALMNPYYDKASWDTDVAGLTIGTYTAGATLTVFSDTISTAPAPDCPGPFGICVIASTVTTTHIIGLDHLDEIMSYPNLCVDCTRAQKVIIDFDQPILAFGADNTSFNFFADLRANGYLVPDSFFLDGRFFGMIEPISKITITVFAHTDNGGDIHWSNIRVATVPEPVTLSLFSVGLIGAVVMRRKRNKTPNSRLN